MLRSPRLAWRRVSAGMAPIAAPGTTVIPSSDAPRGAEELDAAVEGPENANADLAII